jgi:hypothetical protein
MTGYAIGGRCGSILCIAVYEGLLKIVSRDRKLTILNRVQEPTTGFPRSQIPSWCIRRLVL